MNIYFGVTKQCNMRCKYCYVPEYNKNEHENIDLKAIQGTQRFLKKIRDEQQPLHQVSLHGAEPTILSPKTLALIVNMFYSHTRIKVGMQTNGQNLTKEYLELLDPSKTSIGFSIDGYEKLHDENRPHSYKKALENLKTAIEMGFSVSVLSVISKETIKNVDKFFAWIKFELPQLNRLVFKFIHSDEENNLNKEEQELFIDKCIENDCQKPLQVLKQKICLTSGNDCMWYEFDIDGSTYACNKTYNKEGAFANWHNEEFFKIRNKRIHLFRDDFIDEECINCEAYSFCKGGCPSDRLQGISVDCHARKYLYKYRKEKGLNILL